jgi:hypothetical protein
LARRRAAQIESAPSQRSLGMSAVLRLKSDISGKPSPCKRSYCCPGPSTRQRESAFPNGPPPRRKPGGSLAVTRRSARTYRYGGQIRSRTPLRRAQVPPSDRRMLLGGRGENPGRAWGAPKALE